MQTPEETALVENVLNPSYRVLEWGSGGSTIKYSPRVLQYFSLEYDKLWFSDLQFAASGILPLFLIPTHLPNRVQRSLST